MHGYFGPEFHTLPLIKHPKAKILSIGGVTLPVDWSLKYSGTNVSCDMKGRQLLGGLISHVSQLH